MAKGDTIYAIDQPDGVRLSIADPFRGTDGRRASGHERTPGGAARTGEVTVWLSSDLILAIHDEQLAEHGGSTGLRDAGLLDSALARPLNRAGYGEPDTAELAASMHWALPKTILSSTATSAPLRRPCAVSAPERLPVYAGDAEAVVMMLAMAAGELSDAEFTAWVRLNTTSEPA